MNWEDRVIVFENVKKMIEALSRMQKTMMERLYLCVLATKDTKMLSNIFHLKVNEARFARTVSKWDFLSDFQTLCTFEVRRKNFNHGLRVIN